GDAESQAFAKELGCVWAGGSDEEPPRKLDAAIVFAPVGALVPAALKVLDKAGTVVLGGIHMSDVPSFPYSILWEERGVRSVANLTRADGLEFLPLAAKHGVKPTTHVYPLDRANEALEDLRAGRFDGAAVLVP
ncbi:MAG TPA: alcohol dehydrogenase, partial [Hyphomicrobiales bacterium]|nr:alcohol dehydrogenase [Hyphomicrobiales bacterium]